MSNIAERYVWKTIISSCQLSSVYKNRILVLKEKMNIKECRIRWQGYKLTIKTEKRKYMHLFTTFALTPTAEYGVMELLKLATCS